MGFKDAGKPHYLGHRERLSQRFRGAGAAALPDYELFELILFRAAPRRDTKPLAKAILARFGTFAEALNAPEELLAEVPGIGEAAITEFKLVRAAALRLMRGEVLDRPVLTSWAQVLDYCRASMGFDWQLEPISMLQLKHPPKKMLRNSALTQKRAPADADGPRVASPGRKLLEILPAVICAGRHPKFALLCLCCGSVGLRVPHGLPFPAPFWAGHLCENW
jgi:hypothetical protein